MKLGVIVQCPSPHQKILLDRLFQVPGVDVVVAYAFPESPNRNWGIPLADGPTMPVPFRPGLGAGRALRRWIASMRCDAWVLGSIITAFRTQLLASALCAEGVPWAYLGEPPRPRSGWRAVVRNYLLHRVLRGCNGVIATGNEAARRYRALLGDSRPVTSVPYYIPLGDWLALPLIKTPSSIDPIRFLAVAQLIPRKGLDILIEACSRLPTTGWTLDVYGEGPERARLQASIDARGLPITLHRPVAFDRRMDVFRNKHCFVFPSRWDGWGMAVVEALAAGLPVISSDQAMSAHDFISSGINGRIVPCDAGAFAEAMAEVLRQPQQLPAESSAAREAVRGYDPENGAREIVRFCEAMRSQTPGRAVIA